MNDRPILDRSSLEDALNEMVRVLPDWQPILEACRANGPIPLRRQEAGFAGLARIVIGQQVSKASASTMIDRLEQLVEPLDASTLLAMGETPMITAGLSRAKQTTLTGLAHAIVCEGLDLESLCQLPVDNARERLCALKGIGPWTANVFLLFCAGHRDVFPAGDVALQHAAGWVLKLSEKPSAAELEKYAEDWSPWRGVAARVLYAYYALQKGRTDLPV